MLQICMHYGKLYPEQTCFPVLWSRWPLLPDTFASRAPPASAYNGSHFLRDKGYFGQITAAIFTCMYTVYLQKHRSFCRFVEMVHPLHREVHHSFIPQEALLYSIRTYRAPCVHHIHEVGSEGLHVLLLTKLQLGLYGNMSNPSGWVLCPGERSKP